MIYLLKNVRASTDAMYAGHRPLRVPHQAFAADHTTSVNERLFYFRDRRRRATDWCGKIARIQTRTNRQALLDFLSVVRILPVDEQVVETYGDVRAYLETNGQRIGPHDTWIAAHALALELPLVTNNTREFSRVPELVIDNWLQNEG